MSSSCGEGSTLNRILKKKLQILLKAKSLSLFLVIPFLIMGGFKIFSTEPHCCSGDQELSYLLNPKPSQRFHYLVRYETFFSNTLGKEKGFFVILPEDYYQNPNTRYPLLFLLHGYNFHRTAMGWKVYSPEKARRILCQAREEEYHWLLHQDVALIAYAMMDSKNRTYKDLEGSLKDRFEELVLNGGLARNDYSPREIAQSIVTHNLHPEGNLKDSFHPIQKMILVLPDGDNGFYTDENEGKRLFPETKSPEACDHFHQGEAFNYSILPFFYMKPGALGKYETYFLELVQYIHCRSSYRERVLRKRGLAGISMGGFGAMKLGLKYPNLFQSISSQSGLLDLRLLTDKWMLKMVIPEFLEVFGRLEPKKLPFHSYLDKDYILLNNPLTMLEKLNIQTLPQWIYFDYGTNENFEGITQGNQNFEKALKERSHQIPVQPYNGNSSHSYLFWRSRIGNILQHHSKVLKTSP